MWMKYCPTRMAVGGDEGIFGRAMGVTSNALQVQLRRSMSYPEVSVGRRRYWCDRNGLRWRIERRSRDSHSPPTGTPVLRPPCHVASSCCHSFHPATVASRNDDDPTKYRREAEAYHKHSNRHCRRQSALMLPVATYGAHRSLPLCWAGCGRGVLVIVATPNVSIS